MQKSIKLIITFIATLSFVSVAQARDTKHYFPLSAVTENPTYTKGKLDGSVKFYFGDQAHPKILQNFGSDVSNFKTNAFGKTDLDACNWALLSALISLQNHAHKVGANAVVNIVSYYKKNPVSSQDQYECHAGGLLAGVALKGDFVKIAK